MVMSEQEVYQVTLAMLERITLAPREIQAFVEVVQFYNAKLKELSEPKE